jgi:NAD(P)-dependent dehydrogenase (short-subunit alcohol dehydrogenase family)
MSAISVSANWLDGANGDEAEAEEPMATPVFEGQKLVVVGGSSGMGRQTAADVVAAGGSAVIIGQDSARSTTIRGLLACAVSCEAGMQAGPTRLDDACRGGRELQGVRRLREVAARLWAAGQQGKPREHELSGGGDFGGAAGGDGG